MKRKPKRKAVKEKLPIIRKRRVFGRLRVDAGGRPVRLELTKDGLIATPLHSRVHYRMPLKEAVLLVMARQPLKGNDETNFKMETPGDLAARLSNAPRRIGEPVRSENPF